MTRSLNKSEVRALLQTELCHPQYIPVQALMLTISECDHIWDVAFKEVIKLNEAVRTGPSSMWPGFL